MKILSSSVLKRVALVTATAVGASTAASAGIHIFSGVVPSTITIVLWVVLPIVIAVPLALIWLTKLDALENSYRDLMKQATILAQRANLDPLTGLLNRRSFIEQFELAMYHKIGGTFIVVDVDLLKHINDRYGHLTGDEAIIATAAALRTVLGQEALIARIGGDEFCAFIDATEKERVHELLADLAAAVRGEFKSRAPDVATPLTLSAGLAPCKPRQTFRDALGEADKALYVSKGLKTAAAS